MVWVLDDEEGVWPWSVFWRNGEVEQGTNLEGLRALSFSLYLCFFFFCFGVLEHFNRSFFFFFFFFLRGFQTVLSFVKQYNDMLNRR